MNPERTNGGPLSELTIRDVRSEQGFSKLKVRIEPRGDLVLDGSDLGHATGFVGAEGRDYDHTVTVRADWRNTVLLRLMAERFTGTSKFRDWCKSHGIPADFDTWP